MKTVGTNFIRDDPSTKTVTCELNEATSWTSNEVVLTLTKTKTDETVTCTSPDGEAGFSTVGCEDGSTPLVDWTGTGDVSSIKVTVEYTGKETAAFRCDVTVGEAKDSKLVYAEALGKLSYQG